MRLSLSSWLRHLTPALAATALLALASCHEPTSTRAPASPSAPEPRSPNGVVDLLRWSWENRDLTHYREVFTSDFQFGFAAIDTMGVQPAPTLTRDDMLISAQHLFAGGGAEPPAQSISMTFNGTLSPDPDLRPGRPSHWHQQIQVSSLTLEIVTTTASGWYVSEGEQFNMVRGDSAAIPQDLLDRGIRPDSTRWFISRWEDQTNVVVPLGGTHGAMAAPAATLPTRPMTIGRLLLLYRQ